MLLCSHSALGRHLEAETLYYSLVSTADFIGKLDMALALFRASKLQDSVQSKLAALFPKGVLTLLILVYQLLSESQDASANHSNLFTGAAMASYLGGQELCKELLFNA